LPLGDQSVIDWILDALSAAGITDAVVVTGYGAAVLEATVGRGLRHGLRITYVHNRRWRLPNGVSLYAARKAIPPGERFLTVMADHLLSPRIISKVAGGRTDRCLLAVDPRPEAVFDLPDATKVRVVNGEPVAIGKRLRKYNAVDCGLFRFDHRVFDALKSAATRGRRSLTDGVKQLIRGGDLGVLPIDRGTFWIDMDTPKAYREAAGELTRFAGDFHPTRKRRKR
jgi:choline kinase